jgi:hypothetical protein
MLALRRRHQCGDVIQFEGKEGKIIETWYDDVGDVLILGFQDGVKLVYPQTMRD